MKRYQKTKASQYIVVGLVILGIIAGTAVSSIVMRRVSFEDRFAIPWAAGRGWLLESLSPYDPGVAQIAENAILDSPYSASLQQERLFQPFINLLFYLPLSLIPYTFSRLIWVMLLILSILLIAYFGMSLANLKLSPIEKLMVIFTVLFWIPGLTSALLGSLSPIIILLLIISIHLFLNGQDTTAGFILALTIGSFNISGLIIILILFYGLTRRRWSIISAFFSGVAFIIVVSLLLIPSWPRDWVRILVENFSDLEIIQTPLMTLASYLPGVEDFLSIFLHALFGLYFLVMIITIRGKSERVFIWNSFATMVISFLLNVRGSVSEIFLIIPALFLVLRFLSERWGLLGKIFSWVILAFFSIGSWLLFLPSEPNITPVEMPFITIGIPILVFIGMNWIRWWAIKIHRLPFESIQ